MRIAGITKDSYVNGPGRRNVLHVQGCTIGCPGYLKERKMGKLKRISHKKGTLHVETHLGIINITVGLTDVHGQSVEAIEVLPDDFAGEPKVTLDGASHTRLIQLKDHEETA